MSTEPDVTLTSDDAQNVLLYHLVRDIKHALEWLAVGQIVLVVVGCTRIVGDISAHHWGLLIWDGLMMLAIAAACYGTFRRTLKYGTRPATTHRPETTTDAREANPHG